MRKKNQGSKGQERKAAINKQAFDEIIGNPYGYPEPIDGHYLTLKCKSTTNIAETEQKSKSPVNGARPSLIDFGIDVERAVEDGLNGCTELGSIGYLKRLFDNTYLIGTGEIFDQNQRAKIEQIIGNILVQRSIAPASKYFTTIRK